MTDKDEIDELDEDERLIELVGDLLSKEEGETEKEGLTDMKEMEDKKDLPVRSYDFSRDVLKDRAAEVKKTDGGDVSLLKVIPEKEPAVEPSGAEKEEEEEISPRKPVLTREEIIGVIKTVPRVGQAQAIAIVDSGFDGYDRVSGAEVEALRTVPGLGPALAEKVAERLRGKFGPVASDDTDMEKKLEAGKKPEESEPVVAEPESEAEAAVKEPDEAKDKARESDPDPSEEEDGAPEEEEAGEGADKKEAEGDEGAEGDKKEDGEGKDDKGAEEEVKPEGEKKGIWSKIKGLFGKKEGGKEVDKDGTNETDDEKAGGETAGETGQEKEQTLETAGKTAGEKVSEKEAEVAGVPEKDDDGAGELKPEAGMEAGKQIDAASDDLSSDVTEEEIGDIFGDEVKKDALALVDDKTSPEPTISESLSVPKEDGSQEKYPFGSDESEKTDPIGEFMMKLKVEGTIAESLHAAGYRSLEDLRDAIPEDLEFVEGIDRVLAGSICERLRELAL